MSNIKPIYLRIEKDLWAFIKTQSVKQERSMNDIVVEVLSKYKRKCENKLTGDDI